MDYGHVLASRLPDKPEELRWEDQPVGDSWSEERHVLELVKTSEADARARYEKLTTDPSLVDVVLRPDRRVKQLPDGTWPQQHKPPLPAEWEAVPDHFWIEGKRRDLQGDFQKQFRVRIREVETSPGCWNCLDVEILLNGERLGGYRRNYSSLFRTFYPFLHHGEPYALYSTDYTATRVMKLPECVDIGGEERSAYGFCPTGYMVPYDPYVGAHGDFGFVSGCIWGDDSSWKIEVLDLSQLREGKISRSARFGYIELPEDKDLADCIELDWNSWAKPYVKVTHQQTFHLETGETSR